MMENDDEQTHVNNIRLSEQVYTPLEHADSIRIGNGSSEFRIERIETDASAESLSHPVSRAIPHWPHPSSQPCLAEHHLPYSYAGYPAPVNPHMYPVMYHHKCICNHNFIYDTPHYWNPNIVLNTMPYMDQSTPRSADRLPNNTDDSLFTSRLGDNHPHYVQDGHVYRGSREGSAVDSTHVYHPAVEQDRWQGPSSNQRYFTHGRISTPSDHSGSQYSNHARSSASPPGCPPGQRPFGTRTASAFSSVNVTQPRVEVNTSYRTSNPASHEHMLDSDPVPQLTDHTNLRVSSAESNRYPVVTSVQFTPVINLPSITSSQNHSIAELTSVEGSPLTQVPVTSENSTLHIALDTTPNNALTHAELPTTQATLNVLGDHSSRCEGTLEPMIQRLEPEKELAAYPALQLETEFSPLSKQIGESCAITNESEKLTILNASTCCQTASDDHKQLPSSGLPGTPRENSIQNNLGDNLYPSKPPDQQTPEQSHNLFMKKYEPATSFTVDFGCSQAPKVDSNLSEFVPSKIRRSFRERSQKASAAKALRDQKKRATSKSTSPRYDSGSAKRNGPTKTKQEDDNDSLESSSDEDISSKTELNERHKRHVRSAKNESGMKRQKKQEASPKNAYNNFSTYTNQLRPGSQLTEHALYKESLSFDTDSSKQPLATKLTIKSKSFHSFPDTHAKDDEEEDRISEAGTYTIVSERDSQAEQEAREKIECVFGIQNFDLLNGNYLELDHHSDSDVMSNPEDLHDLEQIRADGPDASLDGELGSDFQKQLRIDSPVEADNELQETDLKTHRPTGLKPLITFKDISRRQNMSDNVPSDTTTNYVQPVKSKTKGDLRESSPSIDSLETCILLRDTESVMAAMEARISQSREGTDAESSDNDNSSITATVCGDIGKSGDSTRIKKLEESFTISGDRHKHYRITNKLAADLTDNKVIKSPTPRNRKSAPQQQSPSEPYRRLSLPGVQAEFSVVSDILDDGESDNCSIISDISMDYSESSPRVHRKSLPAKGTMSKTRPNRAFQLRRQQADGLGKSTTQNSGGKSTSRPSSTSCSPSPNVTATPLWSERTDYTGKTPVSLGTHIVRKAREAKPSVTTKRTTPVQSNKQVDVATKNPSRTYSDKSQRLQINAKTKNPVQQSKSQELAAWKRRKEYDPLKAVAEAKAKLKDKDQKFKKQTSLPYVKGNYPNVSQSGACSEQLAEDAHSRTDMILSLREKLDSYGAPRLTSHSMESLDSEQTSPKSCKTNTRRKSAFTPPIRSNNSLSPMSPSLHRPKLVDEKYPSSFVSQKEQDKLESYDRVVISSIYQLSLKLRSATDKTMQKVREGVSRSPSPTDELGQSNSDLPSWKTTNQELSAILKNLRKMDLDMRVITRALFPDDTAGPRTQTLSKQEKDHYLHEIERIRHELAGFQPIDSPDGANNQSQSEDEYY